MPLALRTSLAIGVICLLLVGSSAQAQPASLLRDINMVSDLVFDSNPVGFTEYGGKIYFFASSAPGFPGLWRTDGLTEGTEFVKLGVGGEKLLVSGGMLYFAGSDAGTGIELWKSNGTPEGTVRVTDINPGTGDSIASNIVAFGGALYFAANDGINGIEVWKSDGTEGGTVMLKDIHGDGDSSPNYFTVSDGILYFSATDSVDGRELWKSDGTPGGTVLVEDIRAGSSSSDPHNLVDVDGTLFFSASDGINGRELWASDGTLAGTLLVKDINPGAASSIFDAFEDAIVSFDGQAFFGANSGTGIGLWKSDGTLAGTVELQSNLIPKSFTVVGSTLYIVKANIATGAMFAPNLWKTDGTTPGTALVKAFGKDVNRKIGVLGSTLYLAVGQRDLWKSDGTGGGTVEVWSQLPADSTDAMIDDLTGIGSRIYFSSAAGNRGREPWKSTGDSAGTLRLKDIGQAPGSSTPHGFLLDAAVQKGARLFFFASDELTGRELWKTTGSASGTDIVKDIAPGDTQGVFSDEAVVLGSNLMFIANDGVNGFELWRSDGTNIGTVMVKNIHPNDASQAGMPGLLTVVNGILYFRANDEINGYELWRSDGTAAGTYMVKDVDPTPGRGSEPTQLTNVNGTLFFVANDGVNGIAIWKSDGTSAGTVLVKDIYPINNAVNDNERYLELTNSGGTLFFRADDGVGGHSLWKSNGTTEGTVAILPILFNNVITDPSWFTDVNGVLYFVQHNELWKSNGTLAGTVRVREIDPFPAPTVALSWLTSLDGALYFISSGANGDELWRSAGTSGTTTRLKKVRESGVVGPTQVTGTFAGAVFVSAPTTNGYQLWRSQGTSAGTKAIAPTFVAPITSLAGFGSQIFFGGETLETGNELWVAPLVPSISPSGVVDGASFRTGIAPGGLSSVFGTELTGVTASATALPLPTTLGGVRVQVAGIDAPLLFVSPRQINFQVPFESPIGTVPVVTFVGAQQSGSESATVSIYSPGTFVNPNTGGPIVQRHPDGALITPQNPAKPSDTLIIYVTGIGGLDNPPATGAGATDSPLATANVTPTVTVGAREVQVLFAGLAPGFVGLGQINIVLPNELPQAPTLPLVITFGNRRSQSLPLPF